MVTVMAERLSTRRLTERVARDKALGPLLGPHALGPGDAADYRHRTTDPEICASDGWLSAIVRPRSPERARTSPRTYVCGATGLGWLGWTHAEPISGDGLTAMRESTRVLRHAFRDTRLAEWTLCDLLGVPYPGPRPSPSTRMPDWRDAARRRTARRRGRS